LIVRVVNDIGDDDTDDGDKDIDFRDLLKAKTLHLQRPTQIVWPTLCGRPRAYSAS